MESPKPDRSNTLGRKKPKACGVGSDRTLSPVRFEGKPCRIAAIFNDFCTDAPELSATQTVWRRERDSNSLDRFRHPYKHPSFRDLPGLGRMNE